MRKPIGFVIGGTLIGLGFAFAGSHNAEGWIGGAVVGAICGLILDWLMQGSRTAPRNRAAARLRAIQAFIIFTTFFSIVAKLFVEPAPIQVASFEIDRQFVAAMAIILHGFVVAWIEYRRGMASQAMK